MLEGQMTV